MNTILTAPLVWHNGNIVPKEKLNLFFDINLFMSTCIVETFFTNGTNILFLNETISKIQSLFSFYKFDSILFKEASGETFVNETRRLLIRNFCYKTARCFLLFCEGTENAKRGEFLFIEPDPMLFSLDKILKKAVVSSTFLKPSGNVMGIPTIEHEFRKIIRSVFINSDANDCIILDQQQQVLESYHGNIFLIDGEVVITPSIKTGCSIQLLRSVVINAFNALNFEVIEKDQLTIESLFEAKEVIIAGTTGIYSLRGVEYKRYFDTTRKKLIERLISES
jgi:branched-subunit amino acid aminotransferase/4-amino-4-deoxychorismate lyase